MYRFARKSTVLLLAIAVSILVAACGSNSQSSSAKQTELTVSAAASLTDALNEIQPLFEKAHPDIKLVFNFGASGTLQQQIEQGAPSDLFLSAAVKNMTALTDKQLIDEAHQTNLLNNELVVVASTDGKAGITGIADLAKEEIKKVAIGIPESVPAGKYAQEALTNAQLWDALQPKLVQAKDVRQVLQYVETGNAEAGFVYKTDALTSDKVGIAFAVDPQTYSPVVYPIGIVKATKNAEQAGVLYDYLQSQAALDIFIKYGFSVPAAK